MRFDRPDAGKELYQKGIVSMKNHWRRLRYTPVLPLGPGGRLVTASKEHLELSRAAASEGMVLLKNENNVLPLPKGTKVALFGKATADYVKGGGGSGDVTVPYLRNLHQGLQIKQKEGKVEILESLAKFYEKNVQEQYAADIDWSTAKVLEKIDGSLTCLSLRF